MATRMCTGPFEPTTVIGGLDPPNHSDSYRQANALAAA
jgi:hypothetical protein